MSPNAAPDPGPRSLAELERRFARDLELLTLPPAKQWLEPHVHPEWGPVLDVAIVGAGMAGLAAAFALKCLNVRSMRVFDRAPAGSEGPWITYARMEVLRSPPELRLEPGSECQVGELEGRARQFRRRAQHLHARMGRPWPLETLRGAIEHPHVAHAQALQRKGCGETGHAGADHGDVEHRPPLRVDARLEPLLGGRQREQREVAGKPRLQLGERARPRIMRL